MKFIKFLVDISDHPRNMEQINNITEEINNNVNVIDKPKNQYKFTEKKKLALERMKQARKKKIEDMRNRKIEDKIAPPPKLKRSKAIDMKQEIIKSSSESSSSSTSTDSSNYESDEKTKKIIIHNYDEKESESKLIIKKVRRKNKINHEELKKIYDEVNKEEKKKN